MAGLIYFVAALCVVRAAPPQRGYQHSAQLQQLNPSDFYLDNPEVPYYQQEQKQENARLSPSGGPARLETLEPDSEVELLPGAQPPQQPPQQPPVAPNIPGLIPGQRVFIVHMPVPGIRPGTVGGYQPVYIVAAAPQTNAAYPGYQNPYYLNPSGQPYSPVLGYPTQGVAGNPNLLFTGAAFTHNRPLGLTYEDPYVNYQQASPVQQTGEGSPFRLKQLVSLQSQHTQPNQQARSNDSSNAEPKNASLVIIDSKDTAVEQTRKVKSQGVTANKA